LVQNNPSDEQSTHEASFWQKVLRFLDNDASTEDTPPKKQQHACVA
jgi:hypothetical protein